MGVPMRKSFLLFGFFVLGGMWKAYSETTEEHLPERPSVSGAESEMNRLKTQVALETKKRWKAYEPENVLGYSSKNKKSKLSSPEASQAKLPIRELCDILYGAFLERINKKARDATPTPK